MGLFAAFSLLLYSVFCPPFSAPAAFTSPPFGGYPSQTSPMLWQCYSGLVERTSAVCTSPATHPTNIIPSRTHWGLVEAKAATLTILINNWWMHPGWPVTTTNRLNPTNICDLANVGLDFWTNTPPAGSATSTNGWNGLMRVITNLKWTVAQGAPSDCGGLTNVNADQSGAFCNVDTLESNYTFGVSAAGFPLYEARAWNPGTNVTYQGYEIREIFGRRVADPANYWTVNDCFTNAFSSDFDCQDATETNSFFGITETCGSTVFAVECGYTIDAGDFCAPTGGVPHVTWTVYRLFVTNTITNACADGYACTIPDSSICSHLAPITFDSCTNRSPTNVVADFEFWFNTGATGTCAGAATFTDPFGYGMATNGWTNLFASTSLLLTNLTICATNFATTNRVPWAGNTSTNPMAWAVYDAVLVKKWRFQF